MALKDIETAVEAYRKLTAEEKVIFKSEAGQRRRSSRKGKKLGPRKPKPEVKAVKKTVTKPASKPKAPSKPKPQPSQPAAEADSDY